MTIHEIDHNNLQHDGDDGTNYAYQVKTYHFTIIDEHEGQSRHITLQQ